MQVDWSDDFESLYKKRGQQKYGIRLLALWKIQSGMSETDVCTFLNKTHNTIRHWRQLYESGGLDSLLSLRPGRGRKSLYENDDQIKQDIMELKDQRTGGRIRCQDILEMVAQKHGVYYSQPGMYHVLERLGFSWITSRSRHPKQDPEVQEAFKKKFP